MGERKLGDVKNLNKSEYEFLCEELLLNDLEKAILLARIQEKTIVQMSMENNICTTKVSKVIRKIKKKIIKLYK